MSDRIEVRGLRVVAIHGALAEEQLRPQPFEIDLDVETAFDKPQASDDLRDALDYGELVVAVANLVREEHFTLLETLAEAIASSVLRDQRIDAVSVGVRKLRPPVPCDVDTIGVRVTRSQGARSGA